MSYLADTTDMSLGYEDCTVDTDILFQSFNLGYGIRGETSCLHTVTGDTCYSGRIRINEAEIAASYGDFNHNLDKTLLHEIGHSVGMSHYTDPYRIEPQAPVSMWIDDDCMITGAVDNSADWATFSDHHRSHINAKY